MKKLLSVLAFTIIASTSFLSCSKEKDNDDDENCGIIFSKTEVSHTYAVTVWQIVVRFPNGETEYFKVETQTLAFQPPIVGSTYCK